MELGSFFFYYWSYHLTIVFFLVAANSTKKKKYPPLKYLQNERHCYKLSILFPNTLLS